MAPEDHAPAVVSPPKKKTPVKRAPKKKPAAKSAAKKQVAAKPTEMAKFMKQQAQINSTILQELQQLRKDKCQSYRALKVGGRPLAQKAMGLKEGEWLKRFIKKHHLNQNYQTVIPIMSP